MRKRSALCSLSCLIGLVYSQSSLAKLSPLAIAEDERQPLAKAIQDAVRSRSEATRKRAALALGRIQKPEGLPALLQLLGDASLDVRAEAIFAIGQHGWSADFMGGRDAELAQAVVPSIQHRNSLIRARAIEALAKLGQPASLPDVLKLLKDPSEDVRKEAAYAFFRLRFSQERKGTELKNLATVTDEQLSPLLELLKDKSSDVRRAAAYYFVRYAEPRGASQLVHAFTTDKDLWVRYFAIAGAGKAGTDAANITVPALVKHFESAGAKSIVTERLALIQALRRLKEAKLLPASLASDRAYLIREAMADAAGDAVPGAGAPPGATTGAAPPTQAVDDSTLLRLRGDTSPAVRAAALRSMIKRAGAGSESLATEGLKDAHWVIREAACLSLDGLPPERREKLLTSALTDSDKRVRAVALEKLGGIPGPATYQALTKALSSSELIERSKAIDAIGARTEADVLTQLMKAYGFSPGEIWIEIREQIAGIVAKQTTPESTSALKRMAEDPALSVARTARAELTKRGVTDLPPLPAAAMTYSPYMEFKTGAFPRVTLATSKGKMVIELYPAAAPIHVANFMGQLKAGLYKGLEWHRVVPNFVIQGGDPDRTGYGSAGYSVRAEINHNRFERGSLGMPRTEGFDTGGVQIFINHVPTPHLDGQYTVFGRVISGLDVIDLIERGDRL